MHSYLTATVTPLWLVTPLMVIVTGTLLPGATDSGVSVCHAPDPRWHWALHRSNLALAKQYFDPESTIGMNRPKQTLWAVLPGRPPRMQEGRSQLQEERELALANRRNCFWVVHLLSRAT
jgi:hypothetical protein